MAVLPKFGVGQGDAACRVLCESSAIITEENISCDELVSQRHPLSLLSLFSFATSCERVIHPLGNLEASLSALVDPIN